MRPKVTVIVVAREAATALERTLPALEAQTVRSNNTIFVHLEPRDDTLEVFRASNCDLLLTVENSTSFGNAVARAVHELDQVDPLRAAEEGDAHPNEWLWLLGADNAPEPGALAALLDTAERNPSLEVTGPKLISADDPSQLVEFGRSINPAGETVKLHEHALDQGQHETLSDVLAVAPGGMLIRRDTWTRLQGFDPGLDAVDYSLDFCVRTWLNGGRVLASPDAHVESLGLEAPGTAQFGRRTRKMARYRLRRTAVLHRRLAWSNPLLFLLHWLLLIPEVAVRALVHLLRKQPGRILPDLAAALNVFFGGTRVFSARSRFARTSSKPLSSLDRLRISAAEWRKIQANRRDEAAALTQQGRDRFNFVTGGGGWVLLITAVFSAIMLFPLFSSATAAGGALLPLSPSVGELWASTGYGPRDAGGGVGVADPFQYLIAVLGSLTFWHPSLIVVIIWLVALPLSATGAWFLTARLTRRPWVRAFAGFAWAFAPMLLTALADGRLPAVLVHIALPWFALAVFATSRSWASGAIASLLGLVIAACAPSLIPALVVLWLVVLLRSGRGWVRQAFVPIPAAAMFLPLLVTQINRGRPLAVLADPGKPEFYDPLRGWRTLTGFTDAGLGGWPDLLKQLDLAHLDPYLVLLGLLAPLAVLAIVGMLGKGWRVALAGVLVSVLGWVTAGVAGGFGLTMWGAEVIPLHIGPAQSLGFIGLLGAAVAGAASLGVLRVPVSLLALSGIAALIVPLVPAHMAGTAAVAPSDGRTLPAMVYAQGRAADQLGTLVVTSFAADQVHLHLERGSGLKLDDMSTLATTSTRVSDSDKAMADLTVDFLSEGRANPTAKLHELGIGFILVTPAEGSGTALSERLITGLSANEAVVSIGDIDGFGTLFQVVNAAERPTDPQLARQLEATNWQNVLGRTMLIIQSAILVFVILLALPTGRISAETRPARRPGHRWEDLDRDETLTIERRDRVENERVEVYESAATGNLSGQEPEGVLRD